MGDSNEIPYLKLWREKETLLEYLLAILGDKSAEELSNMTKIPICDCEKIIDDCYRLNQGKDI